MNINMCRIRIIGLNLDRLLEFIKNNYRCYNIERLKFDEILLDISHSSYNKLLSKIDTSCYTIEVVEFGINKIFDKLKKNIALVISTIICLVSVLYLNTRLLDIKIYGVDDSTKYEIEKYLSTKGISVLSNKKISTIDIEKDLLEHIDGIGLVSAVLKGNSLIINVKEKLSNNDAEYSDYIAPYHMIIDSIVCHQGTLLVSENDLVTKGEVVVGAYDIISGEKVAVKPIFTLNATIYLSGVVEFQKIEQKLVRTGKKISNSCYTMFGKDFLKMKKDNSFDLYEEEYAEYDLFRNLFLPIKVKKQIYYELEYSTVEHNFEEEREELLARSNELAKSKLPINASVVNTTNEIIDMGDKMLIQSYIEAKIKITND